MKAEPLCKPGRGRNAYGRDTRQFNETCREVARLSAYCRAEIDSVIPAQAGIQETFGVKTYYVYILASRKNGTRYTGVTNNLLRRVDQHKSTAVPGFTQRHHVHKLVHFEIFGHILDAIKREKCIKRWKRQWKLRLIEQSNPQWRDLFDELVP